MVEFLPLFHGHVLDGQAAEDHPMTKMVHTKK